MTFIFTFPDVSPHRESRLLSALRRQASLYILAYFWVAAVIVSLAAAARGIPMGHAAVPLALIGLVTVAAVLWAPDALGTRLTLTLAINATWMFGLYIISSVNCGQYMLEMHMLYFIDTAIIVACACWRSVVLTTVAALTHHFVLTLVNPGLVWPAGGVAWVHFANHATLGIMNCVGGSLIALSIARLLRNLETHAQVAESRATHDDLTGLLNRRGLRRQMAAFLTGCDEITVVQFDLDGFKHINDTLGHQAGDDLLIRFGERLRALAPPGSALGRIGGDEFVAVLPGYKPEAATAFADRVIDWTRQPTTLAGREVRFGASAGIAGSSDVGPDIDALLETADFALCAAKGAGKNRACRADSALRRHAVEAGLLAEDILRGIAADEFVPYFQTQHDARTGDVVGVEVLARWHHPTRGVLYPADFLGMARSTGRIGEIDDRIMRAAFAAIVELEGRGVTIPRLSLNLSYSRLCDPGLLAQVRDRPPSRAGLTFELLESVFFDALSDCESVAIDALRAAGVRIEIDDFGTGHASIVALTRLRPDGIKIARELVAPLATDAGQVALVRALVEMAQGLGIDVAAEGVECANEARILRDLGVRTLQGYHFSRPVPAGELFTSLPEKQVPMPGWPEKRKRARKAGPSVRTDGSGTTSPAVNI